MSTDFSTFLAALSVPAPKRFVQGTHRARSPADTLLAYRPLLRHMGITRIANVTGLDRIGLPVCVAIRPNARSLATSQGKGETLEAAMVSAMMESIELWHAERIDAPLRHAVAADLPGPAVDTAQLPVRIDATYDPRRPTDWIEGYDLMRGEAVWVPYELVSMNLVYAAGHAPVFFESSNGLSSGNHPCEAAVHALNEVIERDAMALWEHTPTHARKLRQIDLATVTEPVLRELLARLASEGIIVGAWDTTSDVGVPTFSCVILEDPDGADWRPVAAYFGHGTHLDPAVAFSRAIHESIQSRLTAISGSRDDMFHADYIRAGQREDHLRIIAHLRDPMPTRAFPAAPLPVGSTLQDDLVTLLARLAAVGVDRVVIVDLSQPALGIPVVKVVVPGLEPLHTPLTRPGARALQKMAEYAA